MRAPPSRRSAGLAACAASPPGGAAAAMQLSARRSQSSGSRGLACATSCAQCEPWVGHWVDQGSEVHDAPFACLPWLARAAGHAGGPHPMPDEGFRLSRSGLVVHVTTFPCLPWLPPELAVPYSLSTTAPGRTPLAHRDIATHRLGMKSLQVCLALPVMFRVPLDYSCADFRAAVLGRTAVAPESSAARSWAARASAPAARRCTAPTCTRRSLPQR